MTDTDKPFHSKSEMKRIRVMQGKPMYPSDTDKLLAEIGAMLEKASTAYYASPKAECVGEYHVRDARTGQLIAACVKKEDRDFIARSRADLVKLKRMVECALNLSSKIKNELCRPDGKWGYQCLDFARAFDAELDRIARGEG